MKKINLFPLFFAIVTSLFFANRLVQVISLMIIFLYLISFLISKYGYNSISATRERDIFYCRNGNEEYSDITVNNESYLKMDNLVIHDLGAGCYDNSVGIFTETLHPRSKKNLSSILNTRTRGCHRVGPLDIKGSDPLCFFPWHKTIDVYSDVVIYPRYYPLNLLLTEGERGGVQKVKNPMYEDMSELKSMREFRHGDSLKRVNWKATARVGALQTMEFSNTLSAPLFILMDNNPGNYHLKKRYLYLERAIEAAASLAISYNDKRESVGLYTNSGSDSVLIPSGKGYAHTVLVLDCLAKIDFKEAHKESIIKGFLKNQLTVHAGNHIHLIIPEITQEIIDELNLLKRKKYIIKIIIAGAEIPALKPASCQVYSLTTYGEEYYDEI